MKNHFLYRSKIINPKEKDNVRLHYSDLPYIDIEPVTGITIDKTDKISLYARVRRTRVFARNVTRSVIPYFQVESKATAKPDQLDALSKSLEKIKSNAESYRTLQVVVLIFGILFLLIAIYICVYAFKYKRNNSNDESATNAFARKGPTTPIAGMS